jgi:4-aminobutyrate aminotransferase-like enzyme
MGKPMGNGFPIAGVAVVPEVIERFGNDVRYFNTFGGNTVAIAAAQATLDVIREEDVLGNAKSVGDAVRAGAAELAERYECIGDVRGTGLYLGIELVKNRVTKEPDAAATSFVVNELRNRHVLISSTGRRTNTLKIRPPLVFSGLDATRLLTELDATLSSLSVQRYGN